MILQKVRCNKSSEIYENTENNSYENETCTLVFSKDTVDLSAKALSEADGRKYKMDYYKKLREYYKSQEVYNKKPSEKKSFPSIVISDTCSFSKEAFVYMKKN